MQEYDKHDLAVGNSHRRVARSVWPLMTTTYRPSFIAEQEGPKVDLTASVVWNSTSCRNRSRLAGVGGNLCSTIFLEVLSRYHLYVVHQKDSPMTQPSAIPVAHGGSWPSSCIYGVCRGTGRLRCSATEVAKCAMVSMQLLSSQ